MEENQGSLHREFNEVARVMKNMLGQFENVLQDLPARRESNPPVHTEESASHDQVSVPRQQVDVILLVLIIVFLLGT